MFFSNSSVRLTGALILLLVAAGCAGSRDMAMEPEMPAEPEPMEEAAPMLPIVGDWQWSLDTPDGTYTGALIFSMEGDSLMGAVTLDVSPQDSLYFGAMYNEADSLATFSYDSGEFGMMDVELKLDGSDTLRGTQFVRDYSMPLDLAATRKEAEEGTEQ